MLLDAIRTVADWLGDATHGVNAKLAALDFDGSDTAPSGTITIIDETRSNDAAINRDATTPYIRVAAADLRSAVADSPLTELQGDVPLELTIVRSATAPKDVVRDLYYTTRAVLLSLSALFDDRLAAALTARTRNGVQLQSYTELAAAQLRPALTDTEGTAAVLLTVRCRDTAA